MESTEIPLKLISNPPRFPIMGLPFYAAMPPLVHYYLVCKIKMPPLLASLAVCSLLATFPLLVYNEILYVNTTISIWTGFSILRILDVGIAFSSAQLVFWSLNDYVEYFLVMDNQFTRKWAKSNQKEKSLPAWRSRCVPPSERTVAYYTRVLAFILAEFVGFQICLKYALENPITHNLKPLQFYWLNDWKMGTCLMAQWFFVYLGVDAGYTVLFHFISEIYGVPYVPTFNWPLFSRSLRDYWTFRWNVITKEALQRCGLRPLFSLLEKYSKPRTKEKTDDKPYRRPSWHFAIGAVFTFVVSAILHEYIILCLVAEPSYGDHALFFMTHGVLTTVEILIVKAIKSITGGWDPMERLPLIVTMAYTYAVFLWTAPLFLGPLNRSGILNEAAIVLLI